MNILFVFVYVFVCLFLFELMLNVLVVNNYGLVRTLRIIPSKMGFKYNHQGKPIRLICMEALT